MNPFATRPLGNSGLQLPVLGLGGAPLGELYERLDETRAEQTLAAAYRLGVRYFDTAPWYGHGLSEHRFGHFLRRQPRADYLLSTKVGRVYRAPVNRAGFSGAPWAGGLAFEPRFDYSHAGILRSYEDSLQRLGINRADILLIHDLDFGYHRSERQVEAYLRQLDQGGWRALDELRAGGEVRAVGAGINEAAMIPRFLDRFGLDFFLVAMPYTLLDQTPLQDTFPQCERRGVGVVVGAPFASGILATGPRPGAYYNYSPAAPEVIDKTRRIDTVCRQFEVPLAAAALQFPLGHPNVAAVIPGAVSAEQVTANVRLLQTDIPAELWQTLREQGLIATEAPAPASLS